MNRVPSRPSLPTRGSWLSHRPDIVAGLPKPSFHLCHGHLFGIIDDAVHLARAPPALFNRKNPGPPFQGSCAHVKSGHHKGGLGRAEWNLAVGAGRERPAQQRDAEDEDKPSHHGLSFFAYNRQDNARKAHVQTRYSPSFARLPYSPTIGEGLCSKE